MIKKNDYVIVAHAVFLNYLLHIITEIMDLIIPPKETLLSEIITRNQEAIYDSTKKRPLGCSSLRDLPPHLDKYKTTFGMIYEKGDRAGDLINPPRKRIDITNEELENHQHYLISHKHLFPGEQAHRNYKNFDDKQTFGMHTNCDPRGIHVRRAMDWTFNDSNNQHTTIMNKIQIDYKMKHDDILGKVRDPIRDTMKIPDDHIFGLFNKTNDTTVGQLLHGLLPRSISGLYTEKSSIHKQNEFNKKNRIQYSDRFKLMMSVIHHALRKAHYTHGPEIIAILSQLANKSNLIPMIDVRRIFNHFQVPLDEELTEHLFDLIAVPASNEMIKHVKECIKQNKENDITNEKHYHIENDVINWAVDWCKLSELLNWNNDKFMRNCCSGFTTIASNSSSSSVVQPEYYEDTENVHSRLQRAIQANIHHWTTTNSIYTGNLNGLINTHNWEILGEKSLQLDKLVPKFRRSTDHTHYGDEAGVGSIINPSIFTNYGLNNRDLLTLRNKQDILDLFTQANLCYLFNAPLSFNKVWQMALNLDKTLLGNKQPTTDEQVTLQSFKEALFKLHKDSDQQEDRS
ncbi:unnamed protein product [Schistosoma rodhaini]|uniref:EFHB C-terminal EF-hand domain-containing protein n=1 Tax=Schistosoma rodhaini TaxID=6188 RepID=A0AA85GJB8_9TREM|nr:unnamed protein product [Schistosoma rodhaini]